MRTVGRGAGAARQSSPLDVLLLASLGLPCDPVIEGVPLAPVDCVIAGTLFLLREIELLAARRCHITIAEDQRSVTWLLPTSKTDPRAVGVSRSWDCICSMPGMGGICPVHALVRQCARLALTLWPCHCSLAWMGPKSTDTQ